MGATSVYLVYQLRPSADIVLEHSWNVPVTTWKDFLGANGGGSYAEAMKSGPYQNVFKPCLSACIDGKVQTSDQPGDDWFGSRIYHQTYDLANKYLYYLIDTTQRHSGCLKDCEGKSIEEQNQMTYSDYNAYLKNPDKYVSSCGNRYCWEISGYNAHAVEAGQTVELNPKQKVYLPGSQITATVTIKSDESINENNKRDCCLLGMGISVPIQVYLSANDGQDVIQETCAPSNVGMDGHYIKTTGFYLDNGNLENFHCLNEIRKFAHYLINLGRGNNPYVTLNMLNLNYPDCFPHGQYNTFSFSDCPGGGVNPQSTSQSYRGSFTFRLPMEVGDYRYQFLGGINDSWTPDVAYGSPHTWLASYSSKITVVKPEFKLAGTIYRSNGNKEELTADSIGTINLDDTLLLKAILTNPTEETLEATLLLPTPSVLSVQSSGNSRDLSTGTITTPSLTLAPNATITLEVILTTNCVDQTTTCVRPTDTIDLSASAEITFLDKSKATYPSNSLQAKIYVVPPPTLTCTYLPVADADQESETASTAPIPCDLSKPIPWLPGDQLQIDITFVNPRSETITIDGALEVPIWASIIQSAGGQYKDGRLIWPNLELKPNTKSVRTVLLTWRSSSTSSPSPTSNTSSPTSSSTPDPCENMTLPPGWIGTSEEWCNILKVLNQANES